MKSIIFNQHQVNYALKNKEGMFRVVCKRQPSEQSKPYLIEKMVGGFSGRTAIAYPFGESPYQVGETIFVKEAFSFLYNDCGEAPLEPKHLLYLASPELWPEGLEAKWCPSVHMKQEHSRLTLRIKSVKVERLQDISCAQCFLETGLRPSVTHMDLDCDTPNPKDDFKTLWNSTHKKPEEKWEANPFCFVYEYEVVNGK